MESNHFDLIILGAGPAGLTAGIYASRAKMKTLILNEGTVGGQLVLTHEIANYPGVEEISGYMLSNRMKKQAKQFGCTIKSNLKITDLTLSDEFKQVEINNRDTYTAETVILASGGRSRTLGVRGEDLYKGKGISYCATCDGDFFQDKDIIVVGGGNSALEEAVSLTKYASSVTIVHQFDHFQAFSHAVKEAENNSRINFLMESEIIEFKGTDRLEGVTIKNKVTGENMERAIDGVFIFIGYVPSTEFLKGKVQLNSAGEIITDENRETNIRGVFAAGDNIHKKYRQVTTAVADGTIAALAAAESINNREAVLVV